MRKKLLPHVGHAIVVVKYGLEMDDLTGRASDVTIECDTCCEVLVSAEDYDERG